MSMKSLKAFVFAFGVSLVGCGAPPVGTETQQPASEEQPGARTESQGGALAGDPVSSLTCSRDLNSGDTTCYNAVSGGVAPYTYYWRTTETYSWGTPTSSGWYTGGATSSLFYCPRLPIYDGTVVWTLLVEAYVIDAYGHLSPVASKSFNCRD